MSSVCVDWLLAGSDPIGTRWLMMTIGLLFMMGAAGDWGYRVEKFQES